MKKIFSIIAATLICGAMAAPAMADDFTGPRVEARVGLDAAKITANSAVASGLAFGGAVGYDLALTKNVRLGATVALDSSTAQTKFTSLLGSSARRDIEVGGRLGYVVSPSTLVYGLAAYSNRQIGWTIAPKGTTVNGTSVGDGYRFGAGAEFAVTRHLFTKVEYRYSDYGNGNRTNQVLTGAGWRF